MAGGIWGILQGLMGPPSGGRGGSLGARGMGVPGADVGGVWAPGGRAGRYVYQGRPQPGAPQAMSPGKAKMMSLPSDPMAFAREHPLIVSTVGMVGAVSLLGLGLWLLEKRGVSNPGITAYQEFLDAVEAGESAEALFPRFATPGMGWDEFQLAWKGAKAGLLGWDPQHPGGPGLGVGLGAGPGVGIPGAGAPGGAPRAQGMAPGTAPGIPTGAPGMGPAGGPGAAGVPGPGVGTGAAGGVGAVGGGEPFAMPGARRASYDPREMDATVRNALRSLGIIPGMGEGRWMQTWTQPAMLSALAQGVPAGEPLEEALRTRARGADLPATRSQIMEQLLRAEGEILAASAGQTPEQVIAGMAGDVSAGAHQKQFLAPFVLKPQGNEERIARILGMVLSAPGEGGTPGATPAAGEDLAEVFAEHLRAALESGRMGATPAPVFKYLSPFVFGKRGMGEIEARRESRSRAEFG